MPRAYYKPFTIYEEAVGFRNIKALTKGVAACLTCGLMFKVYMMANFSTTRGVEKEMSAEQMEMLASRAQLLHDVTDRDALRRSIKSKLPHA